MRKKYCCEEMKKRIEDWECNIHKEKYECPDAIIDYSENFDEY
jgi:hypothetical protein